MPSIPQHYLDCAIYLYQSVEAAQAGENYGGSGCLVSVASEWGTQLPEHFYAVTNKHVARGGFPVVRLNTIDGKTNILDLRQNDWIPHPEGDDLAVVALELLPETKHEYFPISSYLFLNREAIGSFGSFGAGDDTFMVGRFTTHAGKQRNTPSLRFGSIAMLPFDKLKLPSGYMQEAFLVETRSMSGYSGSPVFVYRPKETSRHRTVDHWNQQRYESSITDLVGTPILLGIDCGHVTKYQKIVDRMNNPHPQGWKVESNTGMAMVIPAWRLEDLLNKPELIIQRKQKDHEYLEEQEAEETVALDVEKPEGLKKTTYQNALKRASTKVSESESGSDSPRIKGKQAKKD